MGLFDFFKSKKVILEHETFGRLLFMGPKMNYFEGNMLFPPVNRTINFIIDAPQEGPSDEQVDFFKTLLDRYDQLSTGASKMIEEEFRNWKEEFRIRNFEEEFELVHFNIRSLNDSEDLELAYNTNHDPHTFTIYFKAFRPIWVGIDG